MSLWLAQHGAAAAALCLAGVSGYVKFCGGCWVAFSLWHSRPRRVGELVAAPDGTWSSPADALHGARLLPATCHTRWWAMLWLGAPDGRRTRICLWRDAFAPADWRRLLILLRESRGDVGRRSS